MKKIIYIFIWVFLSILTSCKEDMVYNNNGYILEETDGRSISVSVDIPETRTRAIDMSPGGTLYLKNIWVGAYRKRDGVRVAGTTAGGVNLGDLMTASNSIMVDLVPLDIKSGISVQSGDTYCVVGIANYDGIVTADGYDLLSKLEDADNWSDFIDIAIDTQQSTFELQRPMLMGYMYQETVQASDAGYTYAKVDQFQGTTGANLPVNLFGNDNINQEGFLEPIPNTPNATLTGINTKYTGSDGKSKNYVLKLRRMRSKINVVINDNRDQGIYISSLRYKVHNNPGSAFLAQRRTNVFNYTDESFNGYVGFSGNVYDVQYSANSADMIENGYFDVDWVTPGDNYNFSFEHFENKHWAIEDLSNLVANSDPNYESKSYHYREAKNDDGETFKYLYDSSKFSTDWNNNASYFEIEFGIRDEKTGKNGLVTYTIHEGFCNDKDGLSLVKDNGDTNTTKTNAFKKRLMDFSCIRNTDYYYYITVNGVDDIKYQVTTSDHTEDGSGSVWQLNYMKPSTQIENYLTNPNLGQGKEIILGAGNEFEFDDPEAIAFRFVGSLYDETVDEELNVDVCYNFTHGELDGFSGLWPVPMNTTEYLADSFNEAGLQTGTAYESFSDFINNTILTNSINFRKMVDKVKVRVKGESGYKNIVEYIQTIHPENGGTPGETTIDAVWIDGYKFYDVLDPQNDDRRNHLRALYIFDKEKAKLDGTRVMRDYDQCSFLYEINGAEQYPAYLSSQTLKMFYATGNKNTTINPKSGNANPQAFNNFSDGNGGEGILLSDNPDIAFRLLGYDGDTKDYYDICYNFDMSDYADITGNGDWPLPNLNMIVTSNVEKGWLDSYEIPTSFLDGMQITVDGTPYDLKKFVYDFEGGRINKNAKLGFSIGDYDKRIFNDDLRSKMRALYVFDKKNKFRKPAIINADETSATYHIFAAEQYPTRSQPQPYPTPTGLPTYTKTSGTLYNFLVPTIGTIVLPRYKINGAEVPLSEYRYRIWGGDYYYDVVESAESDGFHVTIPMKVAKGTNGTLTVQVISLTDEYTDSSKSGSIGTYSFSTLNAWKKDDGGDWDGALNNIANKSYYDGTYLHFSCSNNTFTISDATNGIISFGGTSRLLKFRIYKPCRLSVVGNGNNNSGRQLKVVLDNGIAKDPLDLPSDRTSTTAETVDITPEDFEGVKSIELTLSSVSSGINIRSITLGELP